MNIEPIRQFHGEQQLCHEYHNYNYQCVQKSAPLDEKGKGGNLNLNDVIIEIQIAEYARLFDFVQAIRTGMCLNPENTRHDWQNEQGEAEEICVRARVIPCKNYKNGAEQVGQNARRLLYNTLSFVITECAFYHLRLRQSKSYQIAFFFL